MAYELGAGLGIALFGMLLSRSFSASILLPSGLDAQQMQQAGSSIGEAVQLAQTLDTDLGHAVIEAARSAFITSHSVALGSAGVMLLILAVTVWFSLAKVRETA